MLKKPEKREETPYKSCRTCGDRWINEEDRGLHDEFNEADLKELSKEEVEG